MPDVFNHLDNRASNSNKSNCLINLLVRPIQRDEHVDEDFGLFNDDEDNLTLSGKTMIKSEGNREDIPLTSNHCILCSNEKMSFV